jgi:hypothetical protein
MFGDTARGSIATGFIRITSGAVSMSSSGRQLVPGWRSQARTYDRSIKGGARRLSLSTQVGGQLEPLSFSLTMFAMVRYAEQVSGNFRFIAKRAIKGEGPQKYRRIRYWD